MSVGAKLAAKIFASIGNLTASVARQFAPQTNQPAEWAPDAAASATRLAANRRILLDFL